jgi:sialate O-acetylesterase
VAAGLVPFAIKGAIWYQGCSNNGEGMLYLEKTKALVNGWRKVWGQGDFVYYLVQLAPYNYGPARSAHLPGIWEAQAAVPAAIPNTGYTVINDIGNTKDIHPRNKQDVGHRLAFWALGTVYGQTVASVSGPLFAGAEIKGSEVVCSFTHADGGLAAKEGELKGFVIAGADQKWVPAQAKIAGSAVVVSSSDVKAPAAVRYAWAADPACNLFNGAGLPASPFRTDTFDLPTAAPAAKK